MTTTITASQFRKTIGKYLQMAESEPVIIQRANKEPMVLMSMSNFEMYAGTNRQNEIRLVKERAN